MASVDAYRFRTVRYFVLGMLPLFLCLCLPVLPLFIFEQTYLVSKEQTGPVVPILWVYWVLVVVCYPRWCCRRAAEKSGLICANCLRVAKPSDVRLITAGHNCPYCGKPFFN